MKNLMKKFAGKSNPLMLAEAGSELYNAFNDYTKVIEEEKTKRLASDNITKVNIEGIRAQKDILLNAINLHHETNKQALDKMFDVVDSALESGDNQKLELALSAMVHITQNGNLQQISQLMRDVQNPNQVIDI
ncbi:conserved hypothetical protein [Vibrio chagasii]|jgi:hypothetical protein|nr:conserved hypothetical protein [Vibrio chagasii]|tara:strand:- start:272 stop:670 length:399 start_codon:yes stop_codon:yes gene_type:complete